MKLELSVKGMTCRGCEMHVEKAVKEIKEIVSVEADHNYGKLTVETDKTWSESSEDNLLQKIELSVQNAGYDFEGKYQESQIKAKKINNDGFSLSQWIGIVIILAAVFIIIRETGIMNRLPVLENTMGYGLIFLIGLMTSVHCIGMCGSINLTVSVSGIRGGTTAETRFQRSIPAILYNVGRITSYTIIGGVVGALGSIITITGNTQGIIVGIAGSFMVLMGIRMLDLFPWIDKIIPKIPKKLAVKIQNTTSGKGPYIVGLLNGFIPCGPLQSVQIYALGTGSALSGAISMFLFSLGTVPLMLGFGSIVSIMPSRFHRRIIKLSALLILILGSGMIVRGMSLSGIALPGVSGFNSGSENVRIAEISGDKQYVKTIMHSNEYEPFIIQAGIPVVWTIYAEEADLNGCNNPLTIPEYGIRFKMVPGENIIEFTPPGDETNIIYTCWMGMISSGIKVVEDLNNIDASILGDTAAMSASSEGCGCGSDNTTDNDLFPTDYPPINTDSIGISEIEDNIQYIRVSVTEKGFEPSVIIMQSGFETIWELNGEILNESNYRIFFPSYRNQSIELKEGINSLKIIPEFDFSYYTWKNDFGGFVKVVDDISNTDTKAIIDEIIALNVQLDN